MTAEFIRRSHAGDSPVTEVGQDRPVLDLDRRAPPPTAAGSPALKADIARVTGLLAQSLRQAGPGLQTVTSYRSWSTIWPGSRTHEQILRLTGQERLLDCSPDLREAIAVRSPTSTPSATCRWRCSAGCGHRRSPSPCCDAPSCSG
ncbi:MAG: hypothetical protein ACR2KK_01405 [Acidimicrobiales bacterium]